MASAGVATDSDLAARNAARVTERLTKTHKFAFTADESSQLELLLAAFTAFGPAITTRGAASGRGGGGAGVTFADLTGWSHDDVRQRMATGPDAYLPSVNVQAQQTWWQKMWHR